MRLAMKMSGKGAAADTAGHDADPRERESAEIIDLASRNSYPAVARKSGKSDVAGLVAGIAIVAALGAVTLWSMNSARIEEPAGIGNAAVQPPVQAAVAPAPSPATTSQQVTAPGPVQADPAPSPVLARAPGAANMPVANPYATETLVFDASGRAQRLSGPAAAVAAGGAADAAGANVGGSAGDFASRIGGVGGGTAQAVPLANPATTVTQGTLIPAILETAIDTDVPGFVRAVVSQDVRSFDGRNVLIPRSSRLIGQYQSGVQQGQKRAYVIWTRLIRPDGASVSIASPAVGFDGTTGLPGKVDTHFFQRFGSAMLLSVVSGLSAIGTGGASVIVGGGGQAAAAAAVQSGDKIAPTIRVRQGEPIRVFTARDLDFAGVQ